MPGWAWGAVVLGVIIGAVYAGDWVLAQLVQHAFGRMYMDQADDALCWEDGTELDEDEAARFREALNEALNRRAL